MANPLKKGVAHLKQYMTLTNQKAMGLFMTKQMMMLCEAKMVIENQDASKEPTGKISAKVTTWGAREGADALCNGLKTLQKKVALCQCM
jgi:hypothetical protein